MDTSESLHETGKRTKYRTIIASVFSLLMSPFLFISLLSLACFGGGDAWEKRCHASYIDPVREFVGMFQFTLSIAYLIVFFILVWHAIVKPKDISLRVFNIILGVGFGMIAFLLTI